MVTWSTACLDWKDRIREGRSLLPCGPLFPAEAEAALSVFRDLPIVDVLDKPTFGEIGRPWIFDLPTAIFGAYNPDTKRREINRFFELIPKKNTKSTRAAGIMITELVRNERDGARFVILAPTLEIAKNSSEPAMDFVAEHPELKRFLRPIAHERTIEHMTTKAQLKVIAAASETVGGTKATGVLVDEVWLFGQQSKARNMFREAFGGLASRPEGFVIGLSTESDDPPEGVFADWLARYRDIRDGKLLDPRSLGLLYEFPEEMIKAGAHKDPANFHLVNPNWGASVDPQYVLDEFATAKREGQKSLVGFFAKHLNVQPGMSLRSDNWAGAEFWKKGGDKSITLDAIIARCELIIVGLDGGGLDDLYGVTVLGRETKSVEVDALTASQEQDVQPGGRAEVKRWLSWSHAYAHTIVLERRKSIEAKLLDLQEAGEVTIHDGALDRSTGLPPDIGGIIAMIRKIKDAGLLCAVAVDPAGLGEMIDALATIGVVEDNRSQGGDYVIGAPQGYALMNAIKTAERKVANGTLLQADQALMDWCIGNLKIEPTATAIRATKQNAGDDKIDPAMALFNAVTVMSTNPESARSVYEERTLLMI